MIYAIVGSWTKSHNWPITKMESPVVKLRICPLSEILFSGDREKSLSEESTHIEYHILTPKKKNRDKHFHNFCASGNMLC